MNSFVQKKKKKMRKPFFTIKINLNTLCDAVLKHVIQHQLWLSGIYSKHVHTLLFVEP